MLVAPVRVGSLRVGCDLRGAPAEHESDVDVGHLLLDQEVLCPVSQREPALSFDVDSVVHDEVRVVLVLHCWRHIAHPLVLRLVLEGNPCQRHLRGKGCFES